MRVIVERNVNGAFVQGVRALARDGQRGNSRAGPVVTMPHPVVTVYQNPTERVLFDEKRDANPFFHMFESLWMLAGRRDGGSLDRYVRDFSSRFAERDGNVHGAYGHRWLSSMGFDQLQVVIERLRDNPDDRQCVLQMWDASTYDAWRGGIDGGRVEGSDDLLGNWKDRPCNTHVYLRVRREGVSAEEFYAGGSDSVLDLTVLCRSNDIVWGAYGANAVHFSFLQEYLAGRIGVGVGKMYQFSNNYHAYVDALDKLGDPDLLTEHDPYDSGEVWPLAIGSDWNAWDNDLRKFMEWHDTMLSDLGKPLHETLYDFANPWFLRTAGRVMLARWQWTHAMKTTARATIDEVQALDWRVACQQWIERRRT